MTPLPIAARVGDIAQEGSRLLTKKPALAAAKFEEAHDLALQVGMTVEASALSTLIARSWHLRGSPSRCIYFSRRAVREAPLSSGAHYTLAHFCENAASLAIRDGRDAKPARAVVLFLVAAHAYGVAAHLHEDPSHRKSLNETAERVRVAADDVFVRWWNAEGLP